MKREMDQVHAMLPSTGSINFDALLELILKSVSTPFCMNQKIKG
jgi:hypothetical protein